ncbi:uncharacterized protein LOC143453072 [Clavelina lepadiformis]|uniref:uncharacterized protein LOC143453072 n=1 Tax=Clavelina lepadiformis TaxID=159417 RepID=UPI004041B8C4
MERRLKLLLIAMACLPIKILGMDANLGNRQELLHPGTVGMKGDRIYYKCQYYNFYVSKEKKCPHLPNPSNRPPCNLNKPEIKPLLVGKVIRCISCDPPNSNNSSELTCIASTPAAPASVVVSSVRSSSFEVTWTHTDPNSLTKKYRVYCTADNTTIECGKTAEGTPPEKSLKIKSLSPNTQYTVTVVAVVSDGGTGNDVDDILSDVSEPSTGVTTAGSTSGIIIAIVVVVLVLILILVGVIQWKCFGNWEPQWKLFPKIRPWRRSEKRNNQAEADEMMLAETAV